MMTLPAQYFSLLEDSIKDEGKIGGKSFGRYIPETLYYGIRTITKRPCADPVYQQISLWDGGLLLRVKLPEDHPLSDNGDEVYYDALTKKIYRQAMGDGSLHLYGSFKNNSLIKEKDSTGEEEDAMNVEAHRYIRIQSIKTDRDPPKFVSDYIGDMKDWNQYDRFKIQVSNIKKFEKFWK
jgi:hypothetical protein